VAALAGLAVAAMIGAGVRAAAMYGAGFPLNDGGLFLTMIEDIRASHYALPEFVAYNHTDIPFAYPPLALYVAALAADLTPLTTLQVLQVLPFAVSTLTIGAFFLLARALLKSEQAAVIAVLVFAVIPRSFTWLIMGGGLTRAFGMLFAILALHQVTRLIPDGKRSAMLGAGLFAGLTALSHLEMAWFLAASALLFWLFMRRRRGALVRLAGAAAIGALVAAPWIAAVVVRHGVGPFVNAARTGSVLTPHAIVGLVRFDATGEELASLLLVGALTGAAACLSKRAWLLPVWLLSLAVVDPRSFPTVAALPVALLAGVGASEVLLPLLARAGVRDVSDARRDQRARGSLPLAAAVSAGVFSYAVLGALLAGAKIGAVSPEERDAMAWVARSTPPSSAVLVISANPWQSDRSSEWFPVLAERRSVATPQGLEWLPDGVFARRVEAHADAQACANSGSACLGAWSARWGLAYDYVFVARAVPAKLRDVEFRDCCAGLRDALLHDAGYALVYDGPGATVFERRPAAVMAETPR
jgi:hypothetical protein